MKSARSIMLTEENAAFWFVGREVAARLLVRCCGLRSFCWLRTV